MMALTTSATFNGHNPLESDSLSIRTFADYSYTNPFLKPLVLESETAETPKSQNFTILRKDIVINAIIGSEVDKVAETVNQELSFLPARLSCASLLSPVSISTDGSPSSFVNYDIPIDFKSFKRLKVIQELIDSERYYLDSLYLLSTSYIEPLMDIYQNKIAVPIVLIDKYIKILIENHHHFLKILENDYYCHPPSSTPSIDTEFNMNSSLELASRFSQIVANYALSPYIYESYCILNDQILKLMKSSDIKNNYYQNFETVKDGCEKFIRSIQGEHQSMDLSFISLFQKPISRISKYKLILESLLLQMPLEDNNDYETTLLVSKNLNILKHKLNQVNDNVRVMQIHMGKYEYLFKSLNSSGLNFNIIKRFFKDDDLTSSFSFESFGYPVLCGGLALVTVGLKQLIECEYYGCVLFKSHIFILDKRYHQGSKYDIKFMIPFSCCKLGENHEGLLANDKKSFKILFENNFQLYELLFLCLNNLEKIIWETYLDILINFVNGPYMFDYSLSKQKLLHSMPDLSPFDLSLNKNKKASFKTRFNDCYFREMIYVKVERFDGNKEEIEYTKVEGHTVFLRKRDRINMENKFKHIWSDELRLFSQKQPKDKCINDQDNQSPSTRKRKGSLMRRASIAISDLFRFPDTYDSSQATE